MNKEQSREAGSVMIGWANGKTIQWRRRDQSEWHDIEPACVGVTLSWDWDEFQYRVKPEPKLRSWTASWEWDEFDYRVKPEPKLRPWTADEVPLGAWMRFKRNPQDRVLIGWVSVQSDRDLWLGEREHSIDGGKTWLPCGVEEAKP